MQRGKLRDPLTLQRRVITQNSSGEDHITWSTLGLYWGHVRLMGGREMEAVGQKWADAQFSIVASYRPDITIQREDRFSWGTRTLDILNAEPDMKTHMLTIIAKEFTS